ncbi:MAG: dynamin family protein [Pseudomonadota bacterium]
MSTGLSVSPSRSAPTLAAPPKTTAAAAGPPAPTPQGATEGAAGSDAPIPDKAQPSAALPPKAPPPDATDPAPAKAPPDPFAKLERRRQEVLDALAALRAYSPRVVGGLADDHITTLEKPASVTLIGQVKAGKTALVNALAARPGLLPTDVNPWTSVLTSLHFDAGDRPERPERAEFRFYDREGWERLSGTGGRAAEIAERLGLPDQTDTMRQQAEAMRARTEARLGANFEKLLGNRHRFDTLRPDLLERYVCIGDSHDDDTDDEDASADGTKPKRAGRFAELVQSADLHLKGGFAVPLVLRDTPGVNDPFLVREQITLNALADSEVCLVVLSAHQALTTADVDILRILTALERNDVLLFVNRLDELDDPLRRRAQINARIADTLKRCGLSLPAPPLFGSALWAEAALKQDLYELPAHSARALQEVLGQSEPSIEGAWQASGLPALRQALADRLAEGALGKRLAAVASEGQGLAAQARALAVAAAAGKPAAIDRDTLERRLDVLSTALRRDLQAILYTGWSDLRARLRESASGFAEGECAALEHVLRKAPKEAANWQVDSEALRKMLREDYRTFSRRHSERVHALLERAARDIQGLYDALKTDYAGLSVEAPPVPEVPPAIAFTATLAVDLKTPWWSALLTLLRRSDTRTERLRTLITEEVSAMIRTLSEREVPRLTDDATAVLERFIKRHAGTLSVLVAVNGDIVPRAEGQAEADLEALETILAHFDTLAEASPDPAQAAARGPEAAPESAPKSHAS